MRTSKIKKKEKIMIEELKNRIKQLQKRVDEMGAYL